MSTINDVRETAFRKIVSDMRTAQKQYFQTRSGDDLQAAKELERAVDRALRDQGQQKLWPDGI